MKGYTKIYNDNLELLMSIDNKKVSHKAKLLYIVLRKMSYGKGYCFPSQAYLAAVMQCSTKSIQRYLQQLKNVELITVYRTGKRMHNIYYLTKPTEEVIRQSIVDMTRQFRNPNKDKIQEYKSNNFYKPRKLPQKGNDEEFCKRNGFKDMQEFKKAILGW